MSRASKFDTKIYWDKKTRKLIRLNWDYSVEKVPHWYWSNCHDKHGYIKGKLKTPKTWILLGTVSEGVI